MSDSVLGIGYAPGSVLGTRDRAVDTIESS